MQRLRTAPSLGPHPPDQVWDARAKRVTSIWPEPFLQAQGGCWRLVDVAACWVRAHEACCGGRGTLSYV